MNTSTTAHAGGISSSLGRRMASVLIGGILVISGLAETILMQPTVVADKVNNPDIMPAVLGLQLFFGLALIVYGLVISKYKVPI